MRTKTLRCNSTGCKRPERRGGALPLANTFMLAKQADYIICNTVYKCVIHDIVQSDCLIICLKKNLSYNFTSAVGRTSMKTATGYGFDVAWIGIESHWIIRRPIRLKPINLPSSVLAEKFSKVIC